MLAKVRERNPGETINVSHFTKSIRDIVGAGRKIPEVVAKEIINDLENGEKSNWAWAIGIFLVSKNETIKQYLKKALLDDKQFRAKSALALLHTTKISSTDTESLFDIQEIESGNSFSIVVKFQ
jgi:hypothetical protein